jgi:hypothetical protein
MRASYKTFTCLALLGVMTTPALADRIDQQRYPADSIAKAVEVVRRYVGKKDFESYLDGNLIVLRLNDRTSRSSSSGQRDVSKYFQQACGIEIGYFRREANGRLRSRSREVNASLGANHLIRLKSVKGDAYDQEIAPLFQSVIDSIKSDSRFDIQIRADDDRLSGYMRSDIAYHCIHYEPDRDHEDTGPAHRFLLSTKYVDAKKGRRLAVLLKGSAMLDAFQRARVENAESAAILAAQEQADLRRRYERRENQRARLEAEREAREQAIAVFRENLAVGDETQCGYVIGLRRPMVEIAADIGSRWVHVDQLTPKGTAYASCPKSEKQLADQARAAQECAAQRQSCTANCNAQMTTTDISAPRMGLMLCREQCASLSCD